MTCQQMAQYLSTRPGLCLGGNCPVAYNEPASPLEGCPVETKCCIFDKLECKTQGNGTAPALCYSGSVCPTGHRSVSFDTGCDENQLCCAPNGMSCADQAYRQRPWLCLEGYCPDQYEYRSVFWNSGCPTVNHRCCI